MTPPCSRELRNDGGRVVDGAWIITLREKDVSPQDLEWRFIADDGSIRTGVGIFPPDA
jgi:hypothetical protein